MTKKSDWTNPPTDAVQTVPRAMNTLLNGQPADADARTARQITNGVAEMLGESAWPEGLNHEPPILTSQEQGDTDRRAFGEAVMKLAKDFPSVHFVLHTTTFNVSKDREPWTGRETQISANPFSLGLAIGDLMSLVEPDEPPKGFDQQGRE